MIELILLAQLAIIDCLPNHPGDTRPKGWAWRTIDDRQCWYQGPVMLPRERLRWPPPEHQPPDFISNPLPEIGQNIPNNIPPTEFELRWRGEP